MKRGTIDQAWANRVKVLRAAIRLKHSIAADNELNEVLDEERKKFLKSVQRGQLPPAIDPKKVIDAPALVTATWP